MKLYRELAGWWPMLSAPADYREEASFFTRVLTESCSHPVRRVLELGCGGGNNAFHMKQHFKLTLTDLSTEMLEVSRALNPECEHQQGDMRSIRLDREFDAVFVHDAVGYLTKAEDVQQAVETAFVHCRRGGAALFCPDHVKQTFKPGTSHGGHDGDTSGMRYLEWTWDPDSSDSTYYSDMVYMLRDQDGSVRVENDRHILGLFGREDWLRWLTDVGFESRVVPFEHSEFHPGTMEVYLAVKPIRRSS